MPRNKQEPMPWKDSCIQNGCALAYGEWIRKDKIWSGPMDCCIRCGHYGPEHERRMQLPLRRLENGLWGKDVTRK